MNTNGHTPSPAAEGRRARRRRELHERILETAADLFAREGYERTTVERIASAADIAPATFFNHFPAKEDVLREFGREVFTRFHRLVAEQLERDATTAERLMGFAERGGSLVARAPEMTRRVLIAVLRSSRPGDSGAELADMRADFRALLDTGLEAGDVPADLDTDLFADILVSIVSGAMTSWINDPSYPVDEKLRASMELLTQHLLTAPVRSRARSRAKERA